MRTPTLSLATASLALMTAMPGPAWAQSEIIDGWTDLLISLSRIVVVLASLLGLVYAAASLLRAFRADIDEVRTRHMLAALFAGTFTILGVIIGWISGLLIPGGT